MFRRRPAGWALCLLLLTACGRSHDEPKRGDRELLEIELDEPLEESTEALWGAMKMTHGELLQHLDEAKDDEAIRGFFVQIGSMGAAWARGEDVIEAFDRIRKANKPVQCHLRSTDNLGYLMAARICERISMTPGGVLDLVGLRAQVTYARELLDKLGVALDVIPMGKYKNAAESFTHTTMTPQTRETLDAVLDLLHGRLVDAIATARKLSPERVQQLIDDGPQSAYEAKVAGLVDDVGFDDEARAHAKKTAGATSTRRDRLGREGPESGLDMLFRALFEGKEAPSHKPRIVLAHLDGMIMEGGAESDHSASADAFVHAMRRFGDVPNVRAVVLRIDSPGGSASASDRMWHAVRRVAKRKPVIVSIGDMAASGGYYVAAAGDEIFARDTSLVGSIGVIVGKLVAEDLAAQAGVRVERITRGRNAGWPSLATRFSPTEHAAVERLARSAYRRFVRRVADSRGKQPAEVEKLAQGRLWTGARARATGLVDREGGLWEALQRARERGKVGADAPIETWPERKSLFEALSSLEASTPSQVLEPARLPPLVRSLRDDPVAAVLPWTVELR